jgi:hypothetical protein
VNMRVGMKINDHFLRMKEETLTARASRREASLFLRKS